MGAKNKSNEIHLTRIYEAPVKLVWDAWNDPKQAAQWWGPRGHSIKTHSKDLRVGGHWSYTMYGPNGQTWENKTIYHEVEKYSRLVYDHGGGEDRPPLFRVTVTFEEIKGGKTKMHMIMALDTPEAAEQTKKFIKQASGNSTWDRLGEFLDKEQTGKEKFVINRTFEAPIKKMFELWTSPEHLSKWLPPTGFTMKFIRSDIKVGSTTFYSMENDSGLKMYGRAKYSEITPVTKLVYTQEFTDDKENQTRHPMAPTWPALMQTTVQFAEEGADETRVTITWEVVGSYTPEELDTFIQGRAGMTMGWTGSFDKLEDYIASHSN
jgi:uncharacterized protein YndB with AHSA1/START domain